MNTEQSLRMQSKYISWGEAVVHYTDMNYMNIKKLNRLSTIFKKIHVLAPESGPSLNTTDIFWNVYDSKDSRAKIWNDYLEKIESEWVLFLEDDEEVIFLDFPEKDELNSTRWAPTLITINGEEKAKQYYQMRFVYNDGRAVFQGQDYPDCTSFIIQNDINISNMPIQIERESELTLKVEPQKELSVSNYAPSVYLIEGERCYKNGKYAQAASEYRQLLKKERLLPFDRLAGVNGLASCFTEQFKWDKALALTEQSLAAESLQNLPYLIEFRIYQLQQQWEKAYYALNRYHESVQLHSKASFDVILSDEETLINLADLCIKLGEREKAKEYLNEIFQLKNGNVESSFLNKLLLLCIELRDKERAIFFFKKAFEESWMTEFTPVHKKELNDYMSMFMTNEWFEFVHHVYSELLLMYPKEDEYKRRMIVVSVKTNRIEEARKLAAKVA
ncbi:MAG: tetratricopeptide repeat protein [Gracilimonas sp.]